MLCQSCFENQATTHIKTIVNGDLTEKMLCAKCAKKIGYQNMFNDFGVSFNNFFGSFLSENNQTTVPLGVVRCEDCGSSFSDIAKAGKVGCANCYNTFYSLIIPSIQRMHGNTTHTGKVASDDGLKVKMKRELEKIKLDMQEKIKSQEFEEAAKLRDAIKDIERQMKQCE